MGMESEGTYDVSDLILNGPGPNRASTFYQVRGAGETRRRRRCIGIRDQLLADRNERWPIASIAC
jgi:hypothetical protein